MASFVKLLKGGRDAIRKAQQELEQAKIEERLAFPDAPGALTLYHGSPHMFDDFDFESNLRKGEGAMAYGPGGYMTGNRPLAEHYARGLAQRHRSGSSTLSDPYTKHGGRAVAHNLGALNNFFLETAGNSLARDEMGNLASMGARRRSNYKLSMDSKLDPYTGRVTASQPGPNRFSSSYRLYEPGEDLGPHGTLLGMLGEDKEATLRYLQYKEAVRALDRGMVDGTGVSTMKDVAASPGWLHYMAQSDDLPVPPTLRRGVNFGYGGLRVPSSSKDADWRVTPRNADKLMSIGDELNKRLDPHMDLRMYVDRPRTAPTSRRAPGTGPAPYLYTADYGASPNDMLLYDAPYKDMSSRVQGALADLFLNGPKELRRKLFSEDASRATAEDLMDTSGRELIQALPQDLEGMLMMRDAGIPATAYLRAGPRAGGLGLKFDPEDFNFVIHDQSLLDNVRRERTK